MRNLLLLALATSPALPAQITIREYLIPRPNAFPHDPAVGTDGLIWYTERYAKDNCFRLAVGF
jgi:hypothetical protein